MRLDHLEISDALKQYINSQAGSGRMYSSLSAYFEALVRRDMQQRAARIDVDTLLIEGLESGEALPLAEDWDELVHAEVKRRMGEASTDA